MNWKIIPRLVLYSMLLVVIQIVLNSILNPQIYVSVQDLIVVDEKGNAFVEVIIWFVIPISLVIEECAYRSPYYLAFKKFRGDASPVIRKWYVLFMIFIFALLGASLHMQNLTSALPFEAFKYFLIQFANGAFLGVIFLKYGFWSAYVTHLAYDYILLMMI